MSGMNRYQNPEVFERLAMNYVVGSLQGPARKRFESLMEQHEFLRAVVDGYETRFASLVELLPEEKPPARVWKNIQQEINAQEASETSVTEKQSLSLADITTADSWWQRLFHKGFAFAAVLILASVVLLTQLPSDTDSNIVQVVADLSTKEQEKLAHVVVDKENMKLSIELARVMTPPEGMEARFWCMPKNGGKPMNMGVLQVAGKTEMKIDKKVWRGIIDASKFAVSYEPVGSSSSGPTGHMIMEGKLAALTKT
jgi:anti-sigma-K factor RskA